jgi:hypothetical protein
MHLQAAIEGQCFPTTAYFRDEQGDLTVPLVIARSHAGVLLC